MINYSAMKIMNSSVKKRTSPSSDTERKKMLDAINGNLHEYFTRKISIKDCLLKTGQLTTDLIVYHYSDVKLPSKKQSIIEMMIINYYVILHIDMYTGFYTVNKEFIYKIALNLSEEILKQSMAIRRLKMDEYENLKVQSRDFLHKQVYIIYRLGAEGCIRHVSAAIYNEILSADKNTNLSIEMIMDGIRSVQSKKFLNSCDLK